MKDPTHLQLWKAAKAGDRSALEDLLRSLQDLIFRFCVSQLRNEASAIEATQETAIRLIENLTSFSGHGKLETWTLGIANNVCREFRRKQKKWNTAELDGELAEQPTTDALEISEANDELTEAINRLPDRQREAIVLRYFESLSIAEVATIMQVAEGTVKATLNQAIKTLKVKLEQPNS